MANTPRYVDPHIDFNVRATSWVDAERTPPEIATTQQLQASYDLGWYTVEQLEDLLATLGEKLTKWVGNHPPYEPEA